MKELMTLLEEISFGLMENDYEKLRDLSPKLSVSLMNVFPLIITTYSMEEMRDISQGALEWPKLLEEIFMAMKSDDRFLIVDVLYNKALVRIREFNELLISRGISDNF